MVSMIAEAMLSLRADNLRKCLQDSIIPDNPHQKQLVDFIELPTGPVAVTEERRKQKETGP